MSRRRVKATEVVMAVRLPKNRVTDFIDVTGFIGRL